MNLVQTEMEGGREGASGKRKGKRRREEEKEGERKKTHRKKEGIRKTKIVCAVMIE